MKKPGRPIVLADMPRTEKTEFEANEEWSCVASRRLRGAMRARGWGYAELAEALRKLGIKRSAAVINRRINRGNFTAGFFLACLKVLEDDIEQ